MLAVFPRSVQYNLLKTQFICVNGIGCYPEINLMFGFCVCVCVCVCVSVYGARGTAKRPSVQCVHFKESRHLEL